MRDYGSGSISQRKDGKFEVRLRIVVDGRSKQKSLGYAATRREAVRLLEEGRKRFYLPDGGPRKQGGVHTVATYLNTVFLPLYQATVDSGTYYGFEKAMRKHVIPVIGHKRLDALTGADDKEVQRQAHAKGLSASTIRHVRTMLGTALQYAEGELELPGAKNIVRSRKPIYHVSPAERETLGAGQAHALLQAVAESPYRNAYVLMFFCGLRINEALGLRWDDVNLAARRLRVEQQLKPEAGGGYSLKPPKKGSKGTIDLPAPAVAALQAQKAQQDAEQKAATVIWLNRDGLVFTESNGLHMAAWNVRRDLYRRLAAAGLPRIKPHGLRHSFASVLHDQNVPITVISAQLRHKDPRITLGVYSHMLSEQRGVAGAAMDRAFNMP